MNDAYTQIPFSHSELELSVIARFNKVVSLLPTNLALTGNGQQWTYEQLQRRTDQIANTIRQRTKPGIGCVAYLADHSVEMVICALSILKAGKAFLCVHPDLPMAAKQEVIQDASPDLILSAAQHADVALELAGAHEQCGVQLLEGIGEDHLTGRLSEIDSRDPAVIFYTSGSTGKPKGIVKSHRVILHRAWVAAMDDGVCPSDRQSLLTFCSFASSEADMFGALLNGATVELFDVAKSGLTDFGTWIDQRRITILHPPVVWFRRYLSSLEGKDLHPSVRLVALAGETVLPSDLQQWQQKFSKTCALRHRFSSTEAGHMAVACLASDQVPASGRLPAARPVSDKQLFIVDDNNMPVPPGQSGELLVQSGFLADGYWRRPNDSAIDFSTGAEHSDHRCYRTGDLGYLHADGSFVFLGRKDGQVKIRGYRVETGEVENALLDLPDVREAAVIADRLQDEAQLLGFVVLKPGAEFDSAMLRKLLLVKLPPWKVPSVLHPLDTLPLTLTGKIDRQRLKATLATVAMAPADLESMAVDVQADTTIHRLTQIWQELFAGTRIGPDDDFFALGGHSLVTVNLLMRVSSAFKVNLPWNGPYLYPTISRMAAQIDLMRQNGATAESTSDSTAESTTSRTLKQLTQGVSSNPPLFIVPGGLGGLEPVASGRFVDHFAPELTTYALIARSADGRTPGHQDVRVIASEYVEAIRMVQSTGPYFILGGCVGASVAFEMARQLEMLGERVALLAMIDGHYTTAIRWLTTSLYNFGTSMYLRQLPRHLSKRLWILAKALKNLQHRYRIPYLLRAIRTLAEEIESTILARQREFVPTKRHRFQLQYKRTIRRYRPSYYSGNLKLLLSHEFGQKPIVKEWQRVVGGKVEVEYLDGKHSDNFSTNAEHTAMTIKRFYMQSLAELSTESQSEHMSQRSDIKLFCR